jgi:hypothetical protein
MKKVILAAMLVIAVAGLGSAAQINGSMGLAFFNPTMNDGDLSASTEVGADAVANGSTSGDYSTVPAGTSYGTFTIDLDNIATGGGLTLTSALFGNFVASTGMIVQQSANFLDIYIVGTYSGLPGLTCGDPTICDPTDTSFRASFNLSGDSLGGGATLSSPPAGVVPEPGTWALFTSAIVVVGLVRRRRNALVRA